MSALIYDTATQAFKEAETPKIDSGGVFVDAEGKLYDNNAWVDGWSIKLNWLDVSNYAYTEGAGSVSNINDSIKLSSSYAQGEAYGSVTRAVYIKYNNVFKANESINIAGTVTIGGAYPRAYIFTYKESDDTMIQQYQLARANTAVSNVSFNVKIQETVPYYIQFRMECNNTGVMETIITSMS